MAVITILVAALSTERTIQAAVRAIAAAAWHLAGLVASLVLGPTLRCAMPPPQIPVVNTQERQRQPGAVMAALQEVGAVVISELAPPARRDPLRTELAPFFDATPTMVRPPATAEVGSVCAHRRPTCPVYTRHPLSGWSPRRSERRARRSSIRETQSAFRTP